MLPVVLIATELVFLAVSAMLILRISRQFRRDRKEQGDFWTALEEAAGKQIGTSAARLIVGEPKLWVAIFLWISGHSPRDSRSFQYAASSTSGWRDLRAFAIANQFGAAASHLMDAPLIAAIVGLLGGLLSAGWVRLRRGAVPVSRGV